MLAAETVTYSASISLLTYWPNPMHVYLVVCLPEFNRAYSQENVYRIAAYAFSAWGNFLSSHS